MEPFKNEFSYSNACRIAEAVRSGYPEFSLPRFCKGLESQLAPLELKQRMHLIADRLEAGLPEHPPALFEILIRALSTGDCEDKGLRGFQIWPLTEIVARRGLGHFHEAMSALAAMTPRFTAEFAIRPFLRQHRDRTLQQLTRWCKHPDPHVRRLVSEGSRPLLPWGGNLPELLDPPFPTLKLLEKLHRDPSDYVRLSVSNHLNDFSKHHPQLVINTLKRWLANAPGDPHLEKIARHACRTLLKAGHPGAMALHGYGSATFLKLESITIRRDTLRIGDCLDFHLTIRNTSKKPIRVMFDFAIHHLKANGSHSPKVFKGRINQLAPNQVWDIDGRHPIRPVTTRVYYPGTHFFEPRINGKAHPSLAFTLTI